MTTTHTRRTPEQMIADYEAKIAAVKARAAAKEANASPDGSGFIAAARSLQKAQRTAKVEKNAEMENAIEAALTTLSKHAVEAGLRMPVPRKKEAGRRKETVVP